MSHAAPTAREANGAGGLDEPANTRNPELSNRKAAWLILTFVMAVGIILAIARVLLPM